MFNQSSLPFKRRCSLGTVANWTHKEVRFSALALPFPLYRSSLYLSSLFSLNLFPPPPPMPEDKGRASSPCQPLRYQITPDWYYWWNGKASCIPSSLQFKAIPRPSCCPEAWTVIGCPVVLKSQSLSKFLQYFDIIYLSLGIVFRVFLFFVSHSLVTPSCFINVRKKREDKSNDEITDEQWTIQCRKKANKI